MSRRTRRVVLPLTEWRALGVQRRREVSRAARSGQQHADPYVAQLAQAWASDLLQVSVPRPSLRERVAAVGLGVAVLTALGALLGPEAGGASLVGGLGWRERRLARRILSLGPPRRDAAGAEVSESRP